MPATLTSPYPDDETRTKLTEKIIEEFIEANWDNTRAGVDKAKIAFGKHPTDLLTTDKPITLRCDWFYTKRNIMGPTRTEFIDWHKIQVYVNNPELNTGRDPRAVKILKYLEEMIITNQGDMPKGLYEWILEESGVRPDPEKRNLSVVEITAHVKYIADKVVT